MEQNNFCKESNEKERSNKITGVGLSLLEQQDKSIGFSRGIIVFEDFGKAMVGRGSICWRFGIIDGDVISFVKLVDVVYPNAVRYRNNDQRQHRIPRRSEKYSGNQSKRLY